jgi:hypothetical protein
MASYLLIDDDDASSFDEIFREFTASAAPPDLNLSSRSREIIAIARFMEFLAVKYDDKLINLKMMTSRISVSVSK